MAKIGRTRFLSAHTIGNYSNRTLRKFPQPKSGKYHDPFGRNGPKRPFLAQNGQILTQKWPNLAEPDFCQHIHQVIIVIEHYGSFHSENQANLMNGFLSNGPKGHFWAKMAKFGPKVAKMTKTGFFGQKLKSSHFDHYWCPTSWEVSEKSNEAFSRKTPD